MSDPIARSAYPGTPLRLTRVTSVSKPSGPPTQSAAVPRRVTSLSSDNVTRLVSGTSSPTGRSSATTRESTLHDPLNTMRLPVDQPNDIPNSQITRRNLGYRHVHSVGGDRSISARSRRDRLLTVTDGQTATPTNIRN